MITHSGIKRATFLLVATLVTACTTQPTPEVTILPATATHWAMATPAPTPSLSPIPTPTPTLSPTPTFDPAAFCHIPGEDSRIFVISDEKLQEHHLHYKAEEAFRETIRIHYPAWAEYSQQLTFGKMVVTHDLATIVWDAAPECIGRECLRPYSINPSVILSVLILKYGEVPPLGFDAYQAVRQMFLILNTFTRKARQNRRRGRIASPISAPT